MIIKFPRRLVTEQDRQEAILTQLISMNADFFDELGIDIDPWIEDLVELFSNMLEPEEE